MNKKKYIALTLMLFLLNIQPTSAACTQEEIREFKKIEDNYTVTYEFNKDTKNYTLTANTPTSSNYNFITSMDLDSMKSASSTENRLIYLGVKPGEYTFWIAGNTETCYGILKTITLNLPKYNIYSEDPLCEGIEEFVLCSPTYEKEIDYESFVSRVTTYKKTKQKENGTSSNNDEGLNQNNETLDKIINYVQDNLFEMIIITTFIILLVITMIITAKSIRKSRRLE